MTKRDSKTEVLDYDALAAAYIESLHTNLRNFKQGPDFLDTWVHDEDPNVSIFGIFEAAECGKIPSLTLKVSPETSKVLKMDVLEAQLRQLGELKLARTGETLSLSVYFKNAANDVFKIHPAYRKSVELAATQIQNEGSLSMDNDHCFGSSLNGVTIECLLDANHEVVLQAKHHGGVGLQRVLLDQLCGIMLHRTIQEASDHGVIRLEYKLRDQQAASPVAGILMPENADPAFGFLQQLIRSLFAECVARTKTEIKRNFWDDHASDKWRALSMADKIETIRSKLTLACQELGLQEVGVDVVTVRDDVRVVLSVMQSPHARSFGANLIKLEKKLRDGLEPRLELQLESLTDKNKRIQRTARTSESFKG